jgi:hypothetical protein
MRVGQIASEAALSWARVVKKISNGLFGIITKPPLSPIPVDFTTVDAVLSTAKGFNNIFFALPKKLSFVG